MQTLLMLLSILAWGWMNHTWIAAAMLVSLVLFSLFSSWRWELSKSQFHRFTDLSMLLSVVFLAYSYMFQSNTNPIFSLLTWSPILLTPILLSQLYSTRNSLPMDALFYSMRNQNNNNEINFTLPFTTIALLSAGATRVEGNLYFILSVIFISAILWLQRPMQTRIVVWLLLVSVAIGLSHWGHHGLKQTHNYVQEKSVEWLSDWSTDPYKSRTSIGDIGELKLSDKIEFRVKGDGPLLLHQSSYDQYLGQEWYASRRYFSPFINESDKIAEKNLKQHQTETVKQLDIFQTFSNDAILALPDGVTAIHGLEGAEISQNKLGAVKVLKPPPKANYQVLFSGVNQYPQTSFDLKIPKQHRHWLQKLTIKLQLEKKTPRQIAATIEAFFKTKYFYTLFTPTQLDADQALTEFILERHAGHCEYFAVATVLLLRYSGIPARLANGYSMQEYDEQLGLYIVRRRHSHAWAIAKIEDIWQAVDSTPAQWLDIENANASRLQALWDWFSSAFFRFNQWRLESEVLKKRQLLMGALLILATYLTWLFYKGRKQSVRQKTMTPQAHEQSLYPGLDSEWFQIEDYLQQYYKVRDDNESFFSWINDLHDPELKKIVLLHYRYRFDPEGLSEKQREELKEQAKLWLGEKRAEREKAARI